MRQATRRQTDTPVVLVLGGSGFIGRHAVAALLARGCEVEIGSRQPERIDRKLPAMALTCPRRRIRMEELLQPQDWIARLDGVDAVLNCVGILRQRGRETYDRVHRLAPAALALACRDRGLPLVHVSALGLSQHASSRFLRSKWAGEAAVIASGADWRLVRPPLLDGEGGYGAYWIRRVARWPVHPLPADARGRIALLDVAELGEALASLCLLPLPENTVASEREFELGGPQALPLDAILASLHRQHSARNAATLRIPALLARLASHVCDLLHATPYSFGHYELLRRDNCPQRNRLAELLNRAPRSFALAAAAESATVAAVR